MGQFRRWAGTRSEDLRDFSVMDLSPAEQSGPLDRTLSGIYAGVSSQPDEAAAQVLRLAPNIDTRRAYLAGALRLSCAKTNEVHYYKYLAALIEDLSLVSPAWQPHLLAATVYYLKGSSDPDPVPMQRAKEALHGLAEHA
jgi:hypothetical protein